MWLVCGLGVLELCPFFLVSSGWMCGACAGTVVTCRTLEEVKETRLLVEVYLLTYSSMFVYTCLYVLHTRTMLLWMK